MKKYILTFCATTAAMVSTVAQADDYVCKVYCNSGSTTVVINASSKSDAAKKIDAKEVADKICKDAGKGNASTSTMSSDQCSRK